MVLYGLIRTMRDPLSGYVVQCIAHNDYELSVLVNQLIEKLRQDFVLIMIFLILRYLE